MNILFLNTYKPTSNASGGITRVTCNLGNLFSSNGYRCGVAYYYDVPGSVSDCFERVVQLDFHCEQSSLEELAASYQVYIIQIQMCKAHLYLMPMLYNVRKRFGTKVIYCHHSVPFVEAAGYDFNYLRFLLFHSLGKSSDRLKESAWCLISILMPKYSIKRIAKRRQYVTDHVDKVVLLSDSFIPVFRQYVRCPEDKVMAIGNCVTFEECLKAVESKEKTVLVVSSMNERAKRISTMLHIWEDVSKRDSLKDWNLELIGDGVDLDYYKKFAKRFKLRNCTFEGRQNPRPCYEKGSILMLTSAYEGFGMVILEAQQMGCVPVVYDSYESVRDLIEDGQSGLLVENKNKKEFVGQLTSLMENEQKRREIAVNCINMNNRFSADAILSLWEELFCSLGLRIHSLG